MSDTDLPTIILWTILALVAFIAASLVILFTVRAKVCIEAKEEFRLWVSFLGIKYTFYPKKPKKYNLRKYSRRRIAKVEAKYAKEEAKRIAASKKRRAKARKIIRTYTRVSLRESIARLRAKLAEWPAIDDSADLLITVLNTFFTSFFGRFHFHVARVRIAVGSDEVDKTAYLTTAIGSAIEPLLYAIDRYSNLHLSKDADICVYPDFHSDTIKYDVKLSFSMCLASLIWTILKTAIPGYLTWQEIKPDVPEKDEDDRPASKSKGKSKGGNAGKSNSAAKKPTNAKPSAKKA